MIGSNSVAFLLAKPSGAGGACLGWTFVEAFGGWWDARVAGGYSAVFDSVGFNGCLTVFAGV